MSTTSKTFILACLLAAFIGSWALSSVHVFSWTGRLTGFDILQFIGSGAVLGPKKITLIDSIGLILTFSLVSYYLFLITMDGRLIRTAALSITLPIILIIPYWTASAPLGSYSQSIQTETLLVDEYQNMFSRPSKGSQALNSYQTYLKHVDQQYKKYRSHLRASWPNIDETQGFILFALNITANLYSFGNKHPEAPGGCAIQNEAFGSGFRNIEKDGSDFYLKTPIGCCTDYAVMLKLILDHAGLKNNIVSLVVHGHVFNEVEINGQWYTLDANIGVFYDGRWNDIIDQGKPFRATVFPVLSMQGMNPETYREGFFPFRQKTMMILARGAERTITTNGPALTIERIEP